MKIMKNKKKMGLGSLVLLNFILLPMLSKSRNNTRALLLTIQEKCVFIAFEYCSFCF